MAPASTTAGPIDGEADAAIFTRIVGLATIQRLGLDNLEASPLPLPDAARDYCIAIRLGEPELLARINEGLASLQRNGEYDAIYKKWFGRFEPRRFAREEVSLYVAGALAIVLAVTFWALLRQRQLRQRLARQTEALAESESILAEAQQFARVGHWRRVFATGELVWSDETFRIHDRDPALGPPAMNEMLAWVSPADRLVWDASARRAREDGLPYEFDTAIEPRPGVRKIIHIRGRPTRDATGRINGLFGTVQDITPWREAEHALLRSERLLRAIYENIPYAMGVVEFRDGLWRNISVNPSAIKLLNLAGPPASGLSLAELGLSPERQQFWTQLYDRATETAVPVSAELHHAEKNRDYLTSVVPLGRSGTHERCCFFVEDITARKQKDAEIAQGRRLRAIGELVGGIAHEFNNLLTPILLKADLLRSDWSHEPALVEELQVIADTARRSADLTRRLLTFGRRSDVRPALFTLPSVVEGNFKLLRHTIDRRIAIEADLAPDLPALYLNSGDVQQILLNLLLNARDTLVEKLATQSGLTWHPAIRVVAAALPASAAAPLDSGKPLPPSWIKLTCQDNGMGMPPEVIERVFEPFYTTKQVGQGTGLGLATVWHLVTEMGGRVEVTSRPGEGTSFHVFLPAFLPPVGASLDSSPPFPVASGAGARPPDDRPHLLVAEDEPTIAEIVTHVLRSLGCEVTQVADGLAAWEKLSAHPQAYRAIILDLNMPGLTGLEFLRRARELAYHRPVIITSGRISEDDRQELLALRVTTILPKPFTVGKLVAALQEAGITQGSPK
ncbi:MAG: response regulator [Verrucomicrobia bacterium]|nr:response regulator [Verrucomicrobiota bacterium]